MTVIKDMQEEEKKLEAALDTFIEGYIASLYSGAVKSQVSATHTALGEVNKVREASNLDPVPMSNSLIKEAMASAKEYKELLTNGEGSMVVVSVGDTELYQFYPWLKDLRDDTKIKVLELMDTARTESWTYKKLRSALDSMEDLLKKGRVRNAAFTETRSQMYQAQMRTFKYGGLEFVQRHAMKSGNTCLTCEVLDNRVFRIGEEPPLSHVNCRCFYSGYITKGAWSPDYNKSEYDPEGYTEGVKYPSRKMNVNPDGEY